MSSNEVWLFDVDACLFDSSTGKSWRPGATRLIEHLIDTGCRVILWSAGGTEYAQQRARGCQVSHLFHAFEQKDQRDASGKYTLEFVDTFDNAVLVDDRPEDLPTDRVEGITVRPDLVENRHDRGLDVCAKRQGISIFD